MPGLSCDACLLASRAVFNMPSILPQALLRPGRFDRQISIDRPDIVGREQIFRVYLEKIKLDKPIKHYSERMAALTPGSLASA